MDPFSKQFSHILQIFCSLAVIAHAAFVSTTALWSQPVSSSPDVSANQYFTAEWHVCPTTKIIFLDNLSRR